MLNEIHSPADLKKLDYDQLDQLAYELRREILQTVSRTGGHLSSNLGAVELTLALDIYAPRSGGEAACQEALAVVAEAARRAAAAPPIPSTSPALQIRAQKTTMISPPMRYRRGNTVGGMCGGRLEPS